MIVTFQPEKDQPEKTYLPKSLGPQYPLKRIKAAFLATVIVSFGTASLSAKAEEQSYQQIIRDAQTLYRSGEFIKSARYAFAATEGLPEESPLRGEAHSWITLSLSKLGLENSAAYFFIRTLQSGNRTAVARVLPLTQELMLAVGPDLLRKYLIRHTRFEDYEPSSKNTFLYSLAKEALLTSQFEKVSGYVNAIDGSNALWPFALQIRGTALAIQGKGEQALQDFKTCSKRASEIVDKNSQYPKGQARQLRLKREARDLEARCQAGESRTYYQMEKFSEAERAYEQIPKTSLIWPDLLFEQAWNAYSKGEFNRSLGKLVSYKSPALKFVFNTEVEVLAAQSYLQLCLYSDANETINEFNTHYQSVGVEIKSFVEKNSGSLGNFFETGRRVLNERQLKSVDPLPREFSRLVSRFAKSPYFLDLLYSERDAQDEMASLGQFARGANDTVQGGLAGFLKQVLAWRQKTIRQLGGAFVKNSLVDYHSKLLTDFDKMSFIKLEMLKRAKEKLIYKRASAGDRSRGNQVPQRRNDQYYWSFNGEFWNDELGDYVFGLESECTETGEFSG